MKTLIRVGVFVWDHFVFTIILSIIQQAMGIDSGKIRLATIRAGTCGPRDGTGI